MIREMIVLPDCGHVAKLISLDKYNLGLIENFKQCLVYKYMTLKAARGVVNIGISFNVSIALGANLVHLCLLSCSPSLVQ